VEQVAERRKTREELIEERQKAADEIAMKSPIIQCVIWQKPRNGMECRDCYKHLISTDATGVAPNQDECRKKNGIKAKADT
jgi:hypothetical protein